ncbi:glycine cleavage system aminomethyltransferase GcvT [Streptacidiphilus monticola]
MTLRHTALDAVHRALGATMTDFAGWDMPLRYGSEREEHNAVRTRAGLFDLSHMGEITVTGPQAGELLDRALVGFVSALGPLRARYTMICAADGGILDDLIVYRTGETEFLVVANASNAQVVLDALRDRAAGFDAEVRDDRDNYALVAVQGPDATAIMRKVTDADLDNLKYYAVLPATVAGRDALLARTGYTGEDGFELFVAPADAVELWQALTEAGAEFGLIPCGLSCRDTLRLEAGMPLYGHELNTSLTPSTPGWAGSSASTRPPTAASSSAAPRWRRPPRRLAPTRRACWSAWSPRPPGPPRRDDRGGRRRPGHRRRHLRRSSPTLGKPIAMAYVDAAHAVPGTQVAVDVRGTHEPVEVVALPFYKRAR